MINWKEHPEYITFLKEYIPKHRLWQTKQAFQNEFGIELTKGQIDNFKKVYKVYSGLKGTYSKGHIPYNKGKKQSQELYEKCKPTRFKKGHIPKQTRAVGSERITCEGFIEIKTAEPNVWKFKHRLIWEQHHGEIPKNNVIIFLDGDRQNTNIENLAMITKAERMKLNKDGLNKYKNVESTKARINLAKLELATNKAKKKK